MSESDGMRKDGKKQEDIIKSEMTVCLVNDNGVSGWELIENVEVVPDRGSMLL